MSDQTLKPLSPLGGAGCQIDEIGNIRITEIIDKALASIAMRKGKEKSFKAAVKKTSKLALPQAGKSTSNGDFTIIWMAQDQWFIEAPEISHENLATILKADFKDSASITEQTGGWCCFDVEGQGTTHLLQRLCPIDCELMSDHDAARSVIEHIGVLLICRESGRHFSVLAPCSFAHSLHHALTTAAQSVA